MAETRVTYCRICEAACGLLADVDGSKLVALRPDRNHVVSKGFVCAKGTRFAELHTSPDRLDHPQRREGGRLVRIGWDDALAEIGGKLREIRRRHGPHAVGVYLGNPIAFNYAFTVMGTAFVRALGTRNYFSAASLDCNNKFVVSKLMLGSPATHPVPDLDRARFALLVGTNPSVSQSSFINAPRMVERLQAIERRGGRVVVVDPRRTETARSVGRWLPIVPDTDAALLLGLLHVIFAERLERREVLERHAHGVSELREAVSAFTPDRVSAATGIAAQEIRALARDFASADGAFCHVSTGVNQGTYGSIAYAAKIALELATGNLDREGGALLPRGALDLSALGSQLGWDREPEWRSRIGGFAPVLRTLPTAILADEILTPGEGQIRALIVVAGNPLLSAPDGARLRTALRKLELCVSVDLFESDTGAHATHLLPATDWLEREDLPLVQAQLQPVPYVQWSDPVVPPRAERRPEWRILSDIASFAKAPLFGNRAADLVTRGILRAAGAPGLVLPLLARTLGALPLRALRARPHGVLVERERPGDFLTRRIRTPSRKVELFPREVYVPLGALAASLDASSDPRGRVLRLFTKRERLGHNSWMHSNPALPMSEQRAYFSAADAARLGLVTGQRVRLTTDSGTIELPIEVSRDVVAGAVAVTHGYGHDEQSGWRESKRRGGQNVNLLAASGPAAVDPLSGMCRFVGVPVRVEALVVEASAAAT
jgi:anaerobic selenocysteine-containing dehydrogenase